MLRSLTRLAMLIALAAGGAARAETPLSIFAAASLTNAFTDIGTLWQAQGHPPIKFNFAASSTLAQQIEHGAPADLFASADELWMDHLVKTQHIRPETRADFAGNSLVLVERRDTGKPITLKPGANLAGVLGTGGRLAVGDPASVPAGIYARQALEKLGLWESVKDRLAPADSVRTALLLVAHGEAPAGIVYVTDAQTSPGLLIAGHFPAGSHDPIRYPAAATTLAHLPEATEFLAFLHSQPAGDVFAHYGFSAP
jgi:molybdate transport system substrate-binding protein